MPEIAQSTYLDRLLDDPLVVRLAGDEEHVRVREYSARCRTASSRSAAPTSSRRSSSTANPPPIWSYMPPAAIASSVVVTIFERLGRASRWLRARRRNSSVIAGRGNSGRGEQASFGSYHRRRRSRRPHAAVRRRGGLHHVRTHDLLVDRFGETARVFEHLVAPRATLRRRLHTPLRTTASRAGPRSGGGCRRRRDDRPACTKRSWASRRDR